MSEPEYSRHDITEYVELEARPEKVQRLERIKVAHVARRRYEIWDVQTDAERYWVLTNLTKLYPQDMFPSMDQMLTFHIGLVARVTDRALPEPSPERERFIAASRRLDQADALLNEAEEAEDFQAVGIRCRDFLIDLVQAMADESMVPEGTAPPQRSNPVGWSEHIVNKLVPGKSYRRLRHHMRSVMQSTWDLAVWLQHHTSARRFDAEMVLDAAHHVFIMYAWAVRRFEAGEPDRCPDCGSYQVVSKWRSDFAPETPWLWTCPVCGWEVAEEVSMEQARDQYKEIQQEAGPEAPMSDPGRK